MFFCAGFFHCFFIVNQTDIGCTKQCADLNAEIARPPDHLNYDSARKFLEKRVRAKLSKPGQEIKIPGDKDHTRLYTDQGSANRQTDREICHRSSVDP